jgi:hypothetical protein
MTLPNFVADRQAWDQEAERELRELYPDDDAGFANAWQRRYPVSVEDAVRELRSRGFDVTLERLNRYCSFENLRTVGRNYVLYQSDVDTIAECLAEMNRFSGLSKRRREAGISYTEEQEGIRHVLDVRRRKAAEAVGVSIEQMIAAITVGGISDPAYKPLDVEAAKTWFEMNAKDSEYQHELQEVK